MEERERGGRGACGRLLCDKLCALMLDCAARPGTATSFSSHTQCSALCTLLQLLPPHDSRGREVELLPERVLAGQRARLGLEDGVGHDVLVDVPRVALVVADEPGVQLHHLGQVAAVLVVLKDALPRPGQGGERRVEVTGLNFNGTFFLIASKLNRTYAY